MKKVIIGVFLAAAVGSFSAVAQSSNPSIVSSSISTNYDNDKNPRQTVVNLFDGNINSKWFAESFDKKSFPITIDWAYDSAPVVTAYKLTSSNDVPKRDPKAWTLYGSKNGKKYVKLDSQKGKVWSDEERKTTREFKLDKAAKGYRFFRLEITELVGNEKPQLSEIELVTE